MRRPSPWPLVLAMLLPTVLLLAMFVYLPALIGLQRAFTHWEVGEDPVPAGFANFRRMASDPYLRLSITNLALLLTATLAKTLVAPLCVAQLLVHLPSQRWQAFLRTALTVPMVVPGMVVMLLWGFVYDGSVGLLNQLLSAIGLQHLTRAWLGESSTAMAAIVGIGFPWAGGLPLLIYLAGLGGIGTEIHDAASIDGATGLRRAWSIDIPLLAPQIRLLTVLTTIGTLQDFGSILLLTGGGPGLATHVPALHMYFQAFRFGHFGYAAAIGLVLFGAIFVLSLVQQRIGKGAEGRP